MAEAFLGEIRMFGGNFAPVGWALCQGQLLAISQNDALYALLGTTYGGDGQTTFALPDLRGRVPVHQGTGTGLSPYVLGQQAGSETVTLISNQMPGHGHLVTAKSTAATAATPTNNVVANAGSIQLYHTPSGSPIFDSRSVGTAGGSQPHDNMAPFLTLNFIICLEGIFPTQN